VTHRVAICQPHYIPWVGYFEMIDRVDEFVLLDDVDLIMREWKTRNRIRKQRDGVESKWLTVPIARGSRRGTPIHRARLGEDTGWRRRHLDALREVYAGAPFFADAQALLEGGLGRPSETLGELNVALVADICAYLGIDTPLRRCSDLAVSGAKTDRLVGACVAVGADAYLANNGSAGYLEPARFAERGITVTFQNYEHPRYPQTCAGRGLPFLSHLSVLDLIANQGPASLEVLRSGGLSVSP
jgi:WbqC-like protein family